MNKRLLLLLLLLASVVASAQEMFVGSYNIRYKNQRDSIAGNVWSKRCQVICDQVNFMAPMVFGTQEVLHTQLEDLVEGLDGYDYIGIGRDDGKQAGEYEAIFYKKEKLTLLDSGNFWLNETPDKPALGWDAACIRICTWGKFQVNAKKKRDRTTFYYFNLHMDHVGVVARREAAKLVVRKIKEIASDSKVILTGDFNVDQTNEIYNIFLEAGLNDSYEIARIRFAENGTFNAFKTEYFTNSRIDHVFVSSDIKVESYGLLTDSYWITDTGLDENLKSADAPQEISFNKYIRKNPSDHYPVFVKIKL
jgi:endonuclease/exonuclease/phosphatase family metal-dependent hydrolase